MSRYWEGLRSERIDEVPQTPAEEAVGEEESNEATRAPSAEASPPPHSEA